jgi:hypothetical protein
MNLDLIETLLQQEEETGLAHGRVDLEGHRYRRAAITELLVPLTKTINMLNSRFRTLPKLPNLDYVIWAERMLAFPHLAFLVLDTTGTQQDADIIRIVVADGEGATLFDRVIAPQRQPGRANTQYTGITLLQIHEAPRLADVWNELAETLAGRVVLAYGYDFAVNRLRENAAHYDLAPIAITGECLMIRAKDYFESSTSLKLQNVCYRIGHELAQPATALDRVAGQLAFLQAMSQAVLDIHYVPPKPVTVSIDEDGSEDDLEEHPF